MVSFADQHNIGRSEQHRGMDMGKAIAVSQPWAPQPATAAVAPPLHQRHAVAPVAADAARKIGVALEANSVRLKLVAGRLEAILLGKKPCEDNELKNLISVLSIGMNYALSYGNVPTTVRCLPPVIKQVYPLRKDTSHQSEILNLMIITKNACMNRWFHGRDAAEILTMTNEQCSNFCEEIRAIPDAGGIISKIMPRFYPKMILTGVIVAFEAKRGYDVQMELFHIGRNLPPQERIVLFVVQLDNLETSCIISPPHVCFLVNGKDVKKMCSTSQDNGPQFPSDITKMLNYGTNIIQAVGYYDSNFLIAIAFVRNISSLDAAILKDYVLPSVSALASDSELEGPSRITLNCPISSLRIKTPVKGHMCKHHQCFDYENFMKMNLRNPSWRCPCCNQPTCFVDLRIDQNMAKIIGEAGDEINDVAIFADGSWKMFVETNISKDQLRGGTAAARQDSSTVCQYNRSSDTPIDSVDLTMEDVSGSMTNGCGDRRDTVTYLLNRDSEEQGQYRGPQVQQQTIGLPPVQQAQQQNFWTHQLANILPQSSMQAQPASQTRTGSNRGKQPLGANSAPPDTKRFRMAAPNPSQRTPDGIRMSGSDSLRVTAGMEELQNWRATRRMRGSLSGSAYEVALNQHLVPLTTQPPSTRMPASAVTSVSTRMPASAALDPILQFAAGTEQEGCRPDDGAVGRDSEAMELSNLADVYSPTTCMRDRSNELV